MNWDLWTFSYVRTSMWGSWIIIMWTTFGPYVGQIWTKSDSGPFDRVLRKPQRICSSHLLLANLMYDYSRETDRNNIKWSKQGEHNGMKWFLIGHFYFHEPYGWDLCSCLKRPRLAAFLTESTVAQLCYLFNWCHRHSHMSDCSRE